MPCTTATVLSTAQENRFSQHNLHSRKLDALPDQVGPLCRTHPKMLYELPAEKIGSAENHA